MAQAGGDFKSPISLTKEEDFTKFTEPTGIARDLPHRWIKIHLAVSQILRKTELSVKERKLLVRPLL